MPRWQEAYDTQIDIYRWWDTREARLYAEGFARSIKTKAEAYSGVRDDATPYERWRAEASMENYHHFLANASGNADAPIDLLESEDDRAVQGLINIEKSKMYLADPIWISDEMFELVLAASETFVPEPLLPSDLICPIGFALLPGPITMKDASRKKASFRAISWLPAEIRDSNGDVQKSGITFSLYSYKDDMLNPEVDDYAHEYTDSGIQPSTWGLLHTTPWMFNTPVPTSFDVATSWWRDIQCLFRISMQYISTRQKMYAPRSTRKRANREGLEERDITVITLRRPRQKQTGESTPVDWKHRWIVGGHWRNQFYPSLDTHRQIWIAPYIKGDPELPLHIRKGRVFEVVR